MFFMFIKYFESLLNSNNCFYYPPRISEKTGVELNMLYNRDEQWASVYFERTKFLKTNETFCGKACRSETIVFYRMNNFFVFLNNSFFSFPNDARTKWKNTNVPMSTSQGGPTYSWAISGTACFCGLGNSITDRMIDSKKQ